VPQVPLGELRRTHSPRCGARTGVAHLADTCFGQPFDRPTSQHEGCRARPGVRQGTSKFTGPGAEAVGVAPVAAQPLRHRGGGQALGIDAEPTAEAYTAPGADPLHEHRHLTRKRDVGAVGGGIERAARATCTTPGGPYLACSLIFFEDIIELTRGVDASGLMGRKARQCDRWPGARRSWRRAMSNGTT
jgi:hypothetical protein